MYKYVLVLVLHMGSNLVAQGNLNIPEVLISGGSFDMGCTVEQEIDCYENEYPVRQVQVSSFYMSIYEVTQELWFEVMRNAPSHFRSCKKCPVESITWFDIQDFIAKLNQKTGKNYRLPTEVEWEFAARGGQKASYTRFAGGEDIKALAWCEENSGNKTHPVGLKAPNELGLYDMSGNVWEWCSDSRQDKAVVRGGGWHSHFWDTRVSVTDSHDKRKLSKSIGFRVVRSK